MRLPIAYCIQVDCIDYPWFKLHSRMWAHRKLKYKYLLLIPTIDSRTSIETNTHTHTHTFFCELITLKKNEKNIINDNETIETAIQPYNKHESMNEWI